MEGFLAALLFGGAALATSSASKQDRTRFELPMRVVTTLLALLSVGMVGVGIALHEWLSVSWAVGVLSCCLSLVNPRDGGHWWGKLSGVVALTLATIGVVMSIEGLLPDAPWAIAQAVTHVTYRDQVPLVMIGNGLLNVTALLIASRRQL